MTYNENRIKYTILFLVMIKSVILGLTNIKWLETGEQIKMYLYQTSLTMDVHSYCYSKNVPFGLIWISTVFPTEVTFKHMIHEAIMDNSSNRIEEYHKVTLRWRSTAKYMYRGFVRFLWEPITNEIINNH